MYLLYTWEITHENIIHAQGPSHHLKYYLQLKTKEEVGWGKPATRVYQAKHSTWGYGLSWCLLHWSESLGISSSSSWYREGDIHTCISQILNINLSQNIYMFLFSGEPWLMQMEIQILKKKNQPMEGDSSLKT